MRPSPPLATAPTGSSVSSPAATRARLTGWGGGERVPVEVVRARTVGDLRAAVLAGASRSAHAGRAPRAANPAMIARGMGRSYGDAALLPGGLVLETTALRALDLNPETGIAHAQAGVTLAQLLAVGQPAGWVLPVVPGTQHVSVGGAIAADIHGKNHGVDGTLGTHVLALGLLLASGEVRELSPADPDGLFAATVGGMGLTGVILWAAIQLRRLPSPLLSVDIDRVDDLDAALAALDAPGGRHRVAWLDLLGPGLARGVVTRAEAAEPAAAEAGFTSASASASAPPSGSASASAPPSGSASASASPSGSACASTTVASRLRLPPRWPGALLRPEVVRAHNELRYRLAPRRARGHLEPFGRHMFPLDVLDAWPRLYGAAGFVQYQLVVPRGREAELAAVLLRLRRSRVPCYLAVLKDFGPANDFPLSFPLAGWTLALDLPRGAPGLLALLDDFDAIVAAAGGRVYLAKDARLRAASLAAMYPRLGEWQAVRDRFDPDGLWASQLARRTGLVSTR
jgi:decaprenylphospho-beta-D-ribofuranose 2-oxidase